MKIFKNKFFMSVMTILSVIVLVFGITFSCVDFHSGNNKENISSAKEQPDDTSKYWDESDELAEYMDSFSAEDAWSGSGTEGDPYLIETEVDLAWLAYLVYSEKGIHDTNNYFYIDTYFKQTNDLDVSAYWWQPIGVFGNRDTGIYVGRRFSGHYDGDGHEVSGVFTKAGSSSAFDDIGLFGEIYGLTSFNTKPEIKNLGIVESKIQGYRMVGAIAGNAVYADITNCYNTGFVMSSGIYTGGIVGNAESSTFVEKCYNTGTISGSGDYKGGITGRSGNNSKIESCYNAGGINCTGQASKIGGVVGYLYSSQANNCYNAGTISATSDVGGIAGTVNNTATIQKSYNRGNVTARDGYAGGILNYYPSDNVTIMSCFNIGYVYSHSYSGGISGGTGGNFDTGVLNCFYGGSCTLTNSGLNVACSKMTSENAKDQTWLVNNFGLDFDNTWAIYPNINDGYPTIKIPTYWTDIDVRDPNGNQVNPDTPSGYGFAYFDVTINDTTGEHTGTFTDWTNEPSPQWYLGYGSTIKIFNIRPFAGYDLSGVSAGNGINSDNAPSYYVYRVISADDAITIQMMYGFVTLTVDANGGKVEGKDTLSYSGQKDVDVVSIPVPTREGYTFKGWRMANLGDGYLSTFGKSITKTISLKMGVQ